MIFFMRLSFLLLYFHLLDLAEEVGGEDEVV